MSSESRRRGRPVKYAEALVKTSIALPRKLVEALAVDAKRSGFTHWSEQLRFEVMEPRGMWQEVSPIKPVKDR